MAKPRTFVSSTFYDLADARARLRTFLESIGHEPLLHETPGFGVTPGVHSHEACLDQVDNADYFVLVIGGRRGGTHVGSEKSITSEEYRRAVRRKIPIIVFVKTDVDVAAGIYKKTPNLKNFKSVVDDVRIFDFIDLVKSQSEDNWVRRFDTVENIVEELRGQFAYIHLLFSQRLVKDRQPSTSKGKKTGEKYVLTPFPADFSRLTGKMENEEAASVVEGLRVVHDVFKTMLSRKVDGYEEKCKTLWLLGRYGILTEYSLRMSADSFSQYAWGQYKGSRVFNQLRDFGVNGRYEQDDTTMETEVFLSFRDEEATSALQLYVKALLKKHGEDDSLELFKRGDMRIWSR